MKSNSSSTGIGLSVSLTVAFIVLKLCKVIDWAWIWVISPLWIEFVIVALIIGVAFIVGSIVDRKENKND